MDSVHIEGMGLFGCLLAWSLHDNKVPFTWNDTRAKFSAWQACTGAIFPSGHARDNECLEAWHARRPRYPFGMSAITEAGAYWYSQKTPPHGGRYKPEAEVAGMRLAPRRSLHLNAQTLVERTRMFFAHDEREKSEGQLHAIAHGFDARLHHVVWGWTRLVELNIDPEILAASDNCRPCLYFREGRFTMAYAFPRPGYDNIWYAGSSLIVQREPRTLEVDHKFALWEHNVERLSKGAVSVAKTHETLQGWRPAPDKLDTEMVVQRSDGALLFPSCWHNGVRIWPAVEDSFWSYASPWLGVARPSFGGVEEADVAAAT